MYIDSSPNWSLAHCCQLEAVYIRGPRRPYSALIVRPMNLSIQDLLYSSQVVMSLDQDSYVVSLSIRRSASWRPRSIRSSSSALAWASGT